MKKNNWKRNAIAALLLVMALLPFTSATGTTNQTMTWVILGTKSFTITYGGSCTSSNFFFNEIDANFDPDIDGNAAKVAPSSASRFSDAWVYRDFNFVGVTNPSAGNAAYRGQETDNPPTNNFLINTEITTTQYTNISTKNDTAANSPADNGSDYYPGLKAVYKVNLTHGRVQSLLFGYSGSNLHNLDCDVDSANPTSSGTDDDINLFVYDYNNGIYRRIYTYVGSGGDTTTVNLLDVNVLVDFNVHRFIASDNNVTFLAQGDRELVAGFSCLFTDRADLKVNYYPDNTNFCQSSSVAPMLITNNGSADLNVDGNFSSAFTGVDTNLVLKVWQGTGSGCGSGGFGGWGEPCHGGIAADPFAPVTNNRCRNYNQYNATEKKRLTSSLLVGDTNQLCFSGDFNGFVNSGTHAQTFQLGDFNV